MSVLRQVDEKYGLKGSRVRANTCVHVLERCEEVSPYFEFCEVVIKKGEGLV